MAYKKSNANGQATMANSEPVVIASNQTAIPVSATDLDIRPLVNTDVVTAELSATDNAVLDAIAASVAAIDTDTTTLIGHVDGIETLIGTTNTTLTTIDGRVDGLETSNSAIQTAVQLIDDAVVVAGTDTFTEATSKGIVGLVVRRDANTSLVNTTNEYTALQVNATGELKTAVIQALPAGTNNIGDMDVLSIIPGTAATNLGKARDSAIGATDTGIAMLGVRRDTPTAETPIAGDYVVPQVSANGEQWVRSLVEVADDAAVTLGTQRGLMNAGVAVQTDGTDPTAVSAEGDAAIFRTDMQRNLIVNQTHPRFWHVSADYASAQTNTSVKASPGASLSLYITDITLSNGATAGNITLLDGSGGTVLFEIYPAVNGGVDKQLRSPIKLTAATALCITSTTVTTHSIFVSGYIAP